MEMSQETLLEYFRDIVGSISIQELTENKSLVKTIEKVIGFMEAVETEGGEHEAV